MRNLIDEAIRGKGFVQASDGTEYFLDKNGQLRLVNPKLRGKSHRRREKRERGRRRK